MTRLGLVLASMLALGGCVTAPHYVSGNGGDYYYSEPRAVVGYVPDYFAYSAYYSALWPVYCPWWDAFCDSFHYGITYFPHRYFGYGYTYGLAYSPWYGSWWDSYYDWNWWHYHQRHRSYDAYHRFGSAQNEARAVAMLSRDATPVRGSSLRSAQSADAAAIGGMQGATLRSRSAPLNGDEPLPVRGERNERAYDPYYGAPVRRSGAMGDVRSARGSADPDAAARSPRFHRGDAAFEDGGRAVRRDDGPAPRNWSLPRDDAASGRAPARQDTYSPARQESPRFVPRESTGAFSAPAREAPAPVSHSAPVSSAPARSSRDDGNN